MNSGGTSAGGLNGAPRLLERDESRHDRDGEAAAALWVALAQQVTSAQTLPLAASVSEPTSAWHPSAGDLTPVTPAAVGAGDAPADPKATERMVLRVDGGALGELQVTLERKDGALNVVIGMENQHLVNSVRPDAQVLQRALEGAGITVQSLNVVQASEVGTVLAQRRLSPSGPKPGAPNGAEQKPETDPKRKHKRLTLIG